VRKPATLLQDVLRQAQGKGGTMRWVPRKTDSRGVATGMQPMASERSRYESICLLGEGGMAEVHLGFFRGHANVSKLVVMKQIRSELARDKHFVTMFLDEARLAARLNHPNVVHTYDVLEDGGKYILTMEYLEGQSLFDVLQRIDLQLFPLEEHLWILTQVLAGLQYAHSLADYDGSPLGVVHRDVSPANTFVTYDGDVKLLDFGIAKAGGAVSVTQKGTFKGKLNYCAPEQIDAADPPDGRADIFAVGLMLWEALAGKRIEVGEGYAELAHIRLTGREPRIREVRPDVPLILAKICDRAMALRPASRYLTAGDFQRDLESYLEKLDRRVGRAQVAELMQRHFQTERRDMQKRIKAYLRTTRDTSTARDELPFQEDVLHVGLQPADIRQAPGDRVTEWTPLPTEPAIHPPAAFEAASVAASVSPPSPVSVVAPPRRLRTVLRLALVAVLAGGTTAAIVYWRSLPKQETSSSHASPARLNPSARPASPAALLPAVAPSPDSIHLDISVAPPEAKLTLDGMEVDGSRLQADVPKDRKTHVIRASAPGFAPFHQNIIFSNDMQLAVQLRAEARPPASPARRRAKAQLESRRPRKPKSKHQASAEAAGRKSEHSSPPSSSAPIDEARPDVR
jgi:serine/threonine protein kinase